MLYGIKTFWHPSKPWLYDIFTTPDIGLIVDQLQACYAHCVTCETFISYVPRFEQ